MTELVADRLAAWRPAQWPVTEDWRDLIAGFFASEAGMRLGQHLMARLAAGATIYPPQPLQALAMTPLHAVKVVILGQDPYHGPGQAHGLAFSVPAGVRVPPSLRNIRQEIEREWRDGELVAQTTPECGASPGGDLTAWARQGVLLLNACMTVEQSAPGAHAKAGWEVLTDLILGALQRNPGPIVFMWWGAHAQARRPLAGIGDSTAPPRLHLLANHPSPRSARRKPSPFMGCGHFARANQFLARHGVTPIDWR